MAALRLGSLIVAGLVLARYAHGEQAALIAIDVGHSKAVPGAMSARGKPEFEFNAALAEVIQRALASRQLKSFLIGEDGTMAELRARTGAAAAAHATFLLSVHHDSAQPRYLETWKWEGVERSYTDRFSGFSLFVSRTNAHAEESLRCARLVGLALEDAGLKPTPHHAEPIPGEGRPWADAMAGVYYHDDLVVLATAAMPAVLLEAGVIVNRDEELAVQQAPMRERIAAAVAKGLSGCPGVR